MLVPFNVKVLSLKKIYDMPGTWSDDEYRQILVELEIEDSAELAGKDLFEILLMALQDLDPEDAADRVLASKLPPRVSPGARQNIVQDLVDGQRPWEDVADITLHPRVFAASLLLYQAFPRLFPRPALMQLVMHMQSLKPESRELMNRPPEAAFVTRVLADGMDAESILERLFDEQLAAHSFPEATGVIWLAEFSEQDENSARLTVYSSEHWLEDMDGVSEFQSRAYNDRPPDEDED